MHLYLGLWREKKLDKLGQCESEGVEISSSGHQEIGAC